MTNANIFTDASANPKQKTGVGAYLIVSDEVIETQRKMNKDNLIRQIITVEFENTSSTRLEVQTVLSALDHYKQKLSDKYGGSIRLFTDSQCVAGLLNRRTKLEANDFRSKGKKKPLKNADLYREYYKLFDELGFETIKVKGHLKSKYQDSIQRIFSLVDKRARKVLKKHSEGNKKS